MKKRHRYSLAIALTVFAPLLLVGYIRLPVAAIRSLADYDLLAAKPTVYVTAAELDVSQLQRWWLMRRMSNLTEGDSVPRFNVGVRWNALLVARVRSGHYVGPTGAEGKDCLYVWCFGAWIPVYSFGHQMA